MARVASMNGAPSIAPIPIRAPSFDASPVSTGSRMATMAIMLSGKAVPTAASRLPTAPWRIPRRPPSISIAFVKKAAPSRIAISAATNSTVVNKAHLLSDGPRNAKKRAIAACLPADGLARCASAPVTGREPRSVLTTGPPATAGGYSPIACNPTLQVIYRQRDTHPCCKDKEPVDTSAARRLLLLGCTQDCTQDSREDNVLAGCNPERSERESQACDPGRRPWPRRRRCPDAGLRTPGSGPARRHDRCGERVPGKDYAQRPANSLPRRVHGRARRRRRLGTPGKAAPHGRGHPRQERAGRARGDPRGELRARRKGSCGPDLGHLEGLFRARHPRPCRPAHQHRPV